MSTPPSRTSSNKDLATAIMASANAEAHIMKQTGKGVVTVRDAVNYFWRFPAGTSSAESLPALYVAWKSLQERRNEPGKKEYVDKMCDALITRWKSG